MNVIKEEISIYEDAISHMSSLNQSQNHLKLNNSQYEADINNTEHNNKINDNLNLQQDKNCLFINKSEGELKSFSTLSNLEDKNNNYDNSNPTYSQNIYSSILNPSHKSSNGNIYIKSEGILKDVFAIEKQFF